VNPLHLAVNLALGAALWYGLYLVYIAPAWVAQTLAGVLVVAILGRQAWFAARARR
jgi:hypothetical protein